MARTVANEDVQDTPATDSMTLFEHLTELRQRLVKMVLGFVVGAFLTYMLYNRVLAFLERPYFTACAGSKACLLVAQTPLSGFTTRLNVSAWGGVVIGLPVILYQFWQFVAPGLKEVEKKYALPFIASIVALFVAGGAVAYIIYPKGLAWLHGQSGPRVSSLVSIQSYIDLICVLIAIFGIAFEFPVALVGLELTGVVSSTALRRVRRFSYLGIMVFAAVVTPSSDPFSMGALAVPLVLFYEAAILIGRALKK